MAYLSFRLNARTPMELLDYIKINPIMTLFTKIYHIDLYVVVMCYINHCSYGTCETYKRTSGAFNFNFTVVVKVSVFASLL